MTKGSGSKSGSDAESLHPIQWPTFDPKPSGKFAFGVLHGAHIKGVLIGRLAVWAWVPEPSEHAYTKDLDIAVSREDLPKVLAWLQEQGLVGRQLPIGGVNVKKSEDQVNVDFITRSGEYGDFSLLFEDAITDAEESGRRVDIAGEILPLVSAEHLVVMKWATGEADDRKDAQRVLQAASVNIEKVRSLVATFLGPGAAVHFEVFLRDIGHPEARLRREYKSHQPERKGRE